MGVQNHSRNELLRMEAKTLDAQFLTHNPTRSQLFSLRVASRSRSGQRGLFPISCSSSDFKSSTGQDLTGGRLC